MKIKLHGILAHKFKKEVSLPFEIDEEFIFDALNANLPQFRLFIQQQAQKGVLYQLIKSEKEYNIVPIICGNIGAVLNFVGSTLFRGVLGFAQSVAIGGILNLISPADEESYGGAEEAVVLQSTRFQNLENKEEQGSKVPIGYGRLKVASKLVMQYTEPVSWRNERDIKNEEFEEPDTTYLNPAS